VHTAAEKSKASSIAATADPSPRLRVLIANEKRERLAVFAQVVGDLGHDVVAREIYVSEVAASTARQQPDVALVGLGLSSEHALELIGEIVREASCPVIVLLHASDPAYIHEAAKRGIFAYIIHDDPDELASAIDITLQRFSEYHNLQGAFSRRARIEQAKGILTARNSGACGSRKHGLSRPPEPWTRSTRASAPRTRSPRGASRRSGQLARSSADGSAG
jgi:AmiR/NasT family two-component response regulator